MYNMYSKKTLFLMSILLSALFILSSITVFANSDDATSSYVKIVSLPIGDGAGNIGYTPNIEDCEKRGPESYAIADNGNIFVLDTISNEVEEFSKTGKSLNTYKLPLGTVEYFDIEVTAPNTFYVLNYLGDVLKYENGVIKSRTKFDFPEEQYTAVGLFRDKNNNAIFRNLKTGSDYYVDTRKVENKYAGIKVKNNGEKSIMLTSDAQQFTVNYTFTPAATYPVMNTNAETILLKTEALVGKSIYTETKIEKYQNGKKISNALAMPINGNYEYSVPHKYLYCDNSEKAYQMVLKNNNVEIYQLSFSDKDLTNITTDLINKIQPKDIKPVKEMSRDEVSVSDVDRVTAYWNCEDMITFSWSFNPATMKTPTNSTTECPDYLSSITSTTNMTGLPYCWGGANGDVSACGQVSFSSAISSGKTAGNVLCTGSYKSSTAGVDCSGFISVGYRLSQKYGTSGLASYFTQTDGFSDILPGDIFIDAGSHVVMYRYPNFDAYGNIISYATKEATTSGTDQAKNYTRTLSYIQNNYLPYTLE